MNKYESDRFDEFEDEDLGEKKGRAGYVPQVHPFMEDEREIADREWNRNKDLGLEDDYTTEDIYDLESPDFEEEDEEIEEEDPKDKARMYELMSKFRRGR